MIEIKLDAFEGPLDLLLHLIEVNKVDIYDIPIALITGQYMEVLRKMRFQDMEIMSEFIVMASTLLNIKSRMLLPRVSKEDEEEGDPRQELVEQLLAYKICRHMSSELKYLYENAGQSVFRTENLPNEVAEHEEPTDYQALIGDNTLLTLSRILEDMLKRQEDRVDPIRSRFGRIEPDEIRLKEKTEYIRSYAMSHDRFRFEDIVDLKGGKLDVIVTFLCVLEMMKSGIISVIQTDDQDHNGIEITAMKEEEGQELALEKSESAGVKDN